MCSQNPHNKRDKPIPHPSILIFIIIILFMHRSSKWSHQNFLCLMCTNFPLTLPNIIQDMNCLHVRPWSCYVHFLYYRMCLSDRIFHFGNYRTYLDYILYWVYLVRNFVLVCFSPTETILYTMLKPSLLFYKFAKCRSLCSILFIINNIILFCVFLMRYHFEKQFLAVIILVTVNIRLEKWNLKFDS